MYPTLHCTCLDFFRTYDAILDFFRTYDAILDFFRTYDANSDFFRTYNANSQPTQQGSERKKNSSSSSIGKKMLLPTYSLSVYTYCGGKKKKMVAVGLPTADR